MGANGSYRTRRSKAAYSGYIGLSLLDMEKINPFCARFESYSLSQQLSSARSGRERAAQRKAVD